MHGCPPPQTPTGQSAGQASPSWIICWLTPDTFMSLTHRLPTIGLPNGLRPPILQVSIVDQLNPVQEQTLPNWPHMFPESSDPPSGRLYGQIASVETLWGIGLSDQRYRDGVDQKYQAGNKQPLHWESQENHIMKKTSRVKVRAISNGEYVIYLSVNFSAACPACVLM